MAITSKFRCYKHHYKARTNKSKRESFLICTLFEMSTTHFGNSTPILFSIPQKISLFVCNDICQFCFKKTDICGVACIFRNVQFTTSLWEKNHRYDIFDRFFICMFAVVLYMCIHSKFDDYLKNICTYMRITSSNFSFILFIIMIAWIKLLERRHLIK